jgi:hypothetical protein
VNLTFVSERWENTVHGKDDNSGTNHVAGAGTGQALVCHWHCGNRSIVYRRSFDSMAQDKKAKV